MVSVVEGVCPSIDTRSKSGAMAIPSAKSRPPPPQHAHMPSPVERGGQEAPTGGHPSPDKAASPPPSRGGLWAGPGLLLGWYFARMTKVAGRVYCSFAQIRVKTPFGEIFHVFVFMTCKTIFSKYMWNFVNSKCICV